MVKKLAMRACHSLVVGALGLLVGGGAVAGCSRVINVPVAPIGLSVFVAGDNTLSGVYPEILRGVGAREGCSFEFSVVPRARLDAMFESGRADMLLPASRTPARDEAALFVPLVYSRATLISVASDRPAIKSTQELLDRRDLKVAVVRGFDFGPGYMALIKDLAEQGRLVQDVDAASVGRLLLSGSVDATVMAPSILIGAAHGEPKLTKLLSKLRYEPMDELPWTDSGVYLSKTALNDADATVLREALERASKSGAVWKTFLRYYPANALNGSIRAR